MLILVPMSVLVLAIVLVPTFIFTLVIILAPFPFRVHVLTRRLVVVVSALMTLTASLAGYVAVCVTVMRTVFNIFPNWAWRLVHHEIRWIASRVAIPLVPLSTEVITIAWLLHFYVALMLAITLSLLIAGTISTITLLVSKVQIHP
ncbi:hypothetical protein BJ165DRAFT_1464584, partial [Panaeolus papilionaceus]